MTTRKSSFAVVAEVGLDLDAANGGEPVERFGDRRSVESHVLAEPVDDPSPAPRFAPVNEANEGVEHVGLGRCQPLLAANVKDLESIHPDAVAPVETALHGEQVSFVCRRSAAPGPAARPCWT